MNRKQQYGKQMACVPPERPKGNTEEIRGTKMNTVPPQPPTPKVK